MYNKLSKNFKTKHFYSLSNYELKRLVKGNQEFDA